MAAVSFKDHRLQVVRTQGTITVRSPAGLAMMKMVVLLCHHSLTRLAPPEEDTVKAATISAGEGHAQLGRNHIPSQNKHAYFLPGWSKVSEDKGVLCLLS